MRYTPLITLALTFAAIAQPTLGPDETTESFVTRWNAWAAETDPDSRLVTELDAISRAFYADLAVLSEQEGVWVVDILNSPETPGYRDLAGRAVNRMAPHTARIRELLKSSHAILRFPTRAELEQHHQDTPARLSDDTPPPLVPVNHAELIHSGLNEGASSIRSAASHMGMECRAAIHAGETERAIDDLRGLIDAIRLAAERPTTSDALTAGAIEFLMLDLLSDFLARHGADQKDETLNGLQNALFDVSLVSITERHNLSARAHTEMLASWFDPAHPDRLNQRGRIWFESSAAPQMWRSDGRFVLTDVPDPQALFAPAVEQIRVYRTITDAFARDAAGEPHGLRELESQSLFDAMINAEGGTRLAPALSLFFLHDSALLIDFRLDLQRRAALTMLAVHRHRARTGQWPESLAAIDPEVMRFDPIDPHSGQPFGYAVIDDQPTLWSAGPDRDNDDGRPIPDPPALPAGEFPQEFQRRWFTLNEWNALPPEVQAEYDGDIPLFPPPAAR